MRSGELSTGIDVTDEDGKKLGKSVSTARVAIAQVTLSRVIMASPGLRKPLPSFLIINRFMSSGNIVWDSDENCLLATFRLGRFSSDPPLLIII